MKILITMSAVLFTTSAMAEEIVLSPSKEAIDAFNECQRKGRDECVWPERRVTIPDVTGVADPSSIDETRVFRQAAPDELVSGSENAALRVSIRDADGYRAYEWGFVRTQDGSANPFGSYNGRNSSNASTASQGSTASGQGGGGTATGGGQTNGGGSGGSEGETGGNGSGGSSRGGGQCVR